MTNEEFEARLYEAANENLRKEYDAEVYVDAVLNEMWDGDKYSDNSGNTYHEIGSLYTRHGRPVIIS